MTAITITEEMLEAGLKVYSELDATSLPRQTVEAIYLAMAAVDRDQQQALVTEIFGGLE